tara:strand:- start:1157 stop:2386 length:1230 start_codon:yes stop_codon:yes gene_type:complete
MSMLPFSVSHVNLALMVSSVSLFSLPVVADDWPTLRGNGLSGISIESGLPDSGEVEVLWEAELGLGYSAPVISGGKVIVSGHDGEETDTLFCFDEQSGEVKWKHSYPQPIGDLYFQGGTTGTATIDGDQVFHLARQGELVCLSAGTGAVIWKKHLQSDFSYTPPTWGFGGSPLIQGDVVYLNAGEAGLALNKSDGSVVWQSEDEEAGYSGPYPFEMKGTRYLMFTNKRYYVCVDAETGDKVWEYKWMTRYGVNASDPVVAGDQIFISSGYGKGAVLLKWAGEGEPDRVWQNRNMSTQMNAAVLIDGFLYGIDGGEGKEEAGLKCLEMASGDIKWLDTGIGHGSAVAVKDQLVVLTEEGTLQIGKVSPAGFKATVSQKVLEPRVWTVPVFANGRIYCRNASGNFVVVKLK